MKVKNLIEQLQKFDPELDVRLWTDHGQHDMKASVADVQYATDDEYMIEYSYCAGEYEEETGEYVSTAYKFVSIS